MSLFIKIELEKEFEQLINIDNIIQIKKGDELQLIKVEDHEEFRAIPCYSLLLKNYGHMKITEYAYKQITEKIKELII